MPKDPINGDFFIQQKLFKPEKIGFFGIYQGDCSLIINEFS